MAAARDHLAPERAASVIGLLSVSGAAGVGAGFPISGLVATWFDVHAAFAIGAVFSGLAVVATLLVIPRRSGSPRASLDARGAAVIAAGLVLLLLAISQGGKQGWTSPAVLGLFASAAALLAHWVRLQLATRMPLVDLRQLRHRAVFGADLAALLLGVALYVFLSVVTSFVQMPSAGGFGFDASPLIAGLCLLPFSIVSVASSRLMLPLLHRFGTRFVLLAGSLTISAAGAFFALGHDALWEAFFTLGLVGAGFGFTFAAIPTIITRTVPRWETGSAMGFYQVIRSIGFSVGSALTASILATHAVSERGFVVALWVGSAVCLLAALVCALVSAPRSSGRSNVS
jgi:MFS family permease